MAKDHYNDALLEEIRNQNRRILEALQAMIEVPEDVRTLKQKTQDDQVNSLDQRVTALEVA